MSLMESGSYPPGAENDKNAPYNQDEEGWCSKHDAPSDDCFCEDEHHEWCAVNRINAKPCDCEDYEG